MLVVSPIDGQLEGVVKLEPSRVVDTWKAGASEELVVEATGVVGGSFTQTTSQIKGGGQETAVPCGFETSLARWP